MARTVRQRSRRTPRRGSYGLDAPFLIPIFGLIVAAYVVIGILTGSPGAFVGAVLLAGCGALALHASRRGKFVIWDGLLADLELQGDERILDLGCGRGAVLLLAARHLTTGRAVGVDIWRGRDQSGNDRSVPLRNAAAEGVADVVDVVTADMRALPFGDASFDLVVSNLAIHNIREPEGRDRAVGEAVRVLRPGGRLLIADMRSTRRYSRQLAATGVATGVRGLGWRMWWGGPWVPTVLVAAVKPRG